jgi:hypothetical protein
VASTSPAWQWGHVAFGKGGCIADHIDRYLVTGDERDHAEA